MKNKIMKKVTMALGVVCLCTGMAFAAPMAGIQAEAASNIGTGATVQAHIIAYCYKVEDGALYKRLYNYSTGYFVGDWIFVRYLTEEDYYALGWI